MTRRYSKKLDALLGVVAAVSAVMLSPTLAATALTHDFSQEPASLQEALKSFSEQTGISLVYDARIVAGRKAPELRGALVSRDALAELLSHTPLQFEEIDAHTIAIVERRPQVEKPEAFPAVAEFSSDKPAIDEIIVTASYRAPKTLGGFEASYSLDEDALQLSGAQNVAEPIFELPATVATVSSANTALLVSAGGLNLTDLRGLAPARSLVMLNGRRLVRTNGGNGGIYGVDLNTIPTAFIERVDVINHGAGPSLGTDAVAGVVNIVTRDHIDGISLTASGGLSERGDAEEYSASVYAGTGFASGRGKISGGVSFAMDPSLFFTDRDYLSEPYGFGLGDRTATPANGGTFQRGFGGSIFTPAGSIPAVITESGDLAFIEFFDRPTLFGDGSGFDFFESRVDQRYNWVDGFLALPEIDRFNGYGKVDYEFENGISAYGELLYAGIDTHGQIAAAPVAIERGLDELTGDGLVVSASDPNAPPGLLATVEALVGEPVQSFLIQRRFIELGPRTRDINRQTTQLTAGLNFEFGQNWALNTEYSFGRNRTNDVAGGVPNADRIRTALNPALCNATPGCTPINIFAGEQISPSAAEFYRSAPRKRRLLTTEHSVRATLSRPLYSLGDLEGFLTLGGEFRRDALNDSTSQNNETRNVLGEFQFAGADGSATYGEATASIDLPLLSGAPFAEQLLVGADIRLTRWTGGGFVANLGADAAWSPLAGLEFYAHGIYGGRAPNIVELASSGPDVREFFFDPCGAPSDPVVIANCASAGPLGVPADFEQVNALRLRTIRGNPDLDNEKVATWHLGVAVDVQELVDMNDDALRFTADWRRHKITNAIGFGDRQPLFACYESANLSNKYCGTNPGTGELFIQRDPLTGQVLEEQQTYVNGGAIETSGLDASMAYRGELIWAPLEPSLTIDLLYSYTHRMAIHETAKIEYESVLGLPQFPRHQIYATGALETERLKTLWTVRRRGATDTVLDSDIPETTMPAITYVDAGFQFRPTDNVVLFAGIENLFDKKLPVAAFAERGFYPEYFDIVGRSYFAGVRAEF